MPLFQILSKGECKKCPYSFNRTVVFGRAGTSAPKIALIGEAPGETEDKLGEPFVGSSGKFLQVAVSKSGLLWQNLYKTNVILCRPENNNITSSDAEDAIFFCKKRFIKEVQTLTKTVRVFVALGGTATKAFGIQGSITKVRGSVFIVKYDTVTKEFKTVNKQDKDSFIVIPTFHPSFIMRGQFAEEVTWRNDLEKAQDFSTKKYVAPKEKFTTEPTAEDVVQFVKSCVSNKKLVGVDLETTSLEPKTNCIIMVGLAVDGEEALVVPLLDKGGVEYFKPNGRKKVEATLCELFKKGRVMFQNALFDVKHIEFAFGCEVKNIEHDILLLHHCIHPELPHNLGYIVSVYGKTPYWKATILGREKRLIDVDQHELRTYNARDSVVLHQVLKPMLEDLKEVGTEGVYKNISMGLIRPILTMEYTGVKLDLKKLKAFKKDLDSQIKSLKEEFFKRFNVPEGFNMNSGNDLKLLLFGETPNKLDTALKVIGEVVEKSLNKTTKKYLDAKKVVSMCEGIIPILNESFIKKRTEKRQISLDDDAMLMLKRSLLKSIEMENDKKKPSLEKREKFYTAVVFCNILIKYREVSKMKSTYTDFSIWKDERLHGEYLIHGTSTGRLSSRNPNMQNFPKEAKKMFVPEEGNIFVQADFSNLELRILGFVSNDMVLQKLFDEGLNVHSENCKIMFEIDEKHELWDLARKACKTYIFGRNYGGKLKGIFERVSKEVPELNLPFSRFQKIDRAYRSKHPAYVKWETSVKMEVHATRKLTSALGRIRYFLGTYSEIEREGLNFPIQSVAADVMNTGLISLQKYLPKGFKLCASVHDSVLLEVPEKRKEEAEELLKKCLENKFKIGGKLRVFPIDIKTGDSWGDV